MSFIIGNKSFYVSKNRPIKNKFSFSKTNLCDNTLIDSIFPIGISVHAANTRMWATLVVEHVEYEFLIRT